METKNKKKLIMQFFLDENIVKDKKIDIGKVSGQIVEDYFNNQFKKELKEKNREISNNKNSIAIKIEVKTRKRKSKRK